MNQNARSISLITLLLLISFASVNAVLFTPALPDIAHYFQMTVDHAQQTITWFLIGYTLGQLIYGSFANRFGRKPALYGGIGLQIISSILCMLSATFHQYVLLIIGRFFLALGAGVGLKMAFTIVNDVYSPKVASQKIAYLVLAFAVTPALSVALGGYLNANYGWTSCFFAGAVYGLLLWILVTKLPETQLNLDPDALKINHLWQGYASQFTNPSLIAGGLLMGSVSSMVYVFSAVAPFVAINLFHLPSKTYGLFNLVQAVGLVLGSIASAQASKIWTLKQSIRFGLGITFMGVLMMVLAVKMALPPFYVLFAPMILINFGLSFIIANASTVAMSSAANKAYASAVMNFVNMGTATLSVMSLSWFSMTLWLLPLVYLFLCAFMVFIFQKLVA